MHLAIAMPLVGVFVAAATLAAAMRRKGLVGVITEAGLNAPDRTVANPTAIRPTSSAVSRR